MWGWVVQNKEWVFSGAGLTVLGVIWWLFAKFWQKREVVTAAPVVTQAPSASIAPSIVMNPTINFPIEPRAPELPKQASPLVAPALAKPKPRPNLCIEATKIGMISLQGDIWTLKQNSGGWEREPRYPSVARGYFQRSD